MHHALADPKDAIRSQLDGMGARVRRERDRQGWSVIRLSAACGISPVALRYLEGTPSCRTDVDNALLLARALDVRLEWLLTGRGRRRVPAPVAKPAPE